MRNKSTDKAMARVLVIAAPFVSIFVSTSSSADPVNVPKMLILAPLAFVSMGLALQKGKDLLLREMRATVIFSAFFLMALVASLLFSSAPKSQMFFGTYGRNTGFLTYLSLLFLLFSASLVRSHDFPRQIVKGFIVVGIVNVLYCLMQLAKIDPLPWNNTYGYILGTFGNPDFISAFLGMSVVVMLAISLGDIKNWKVVAFALVYAALALIEIKTSHAIQGFMVTLIGSAIVVFFYLRSLTKGNLIVSSYSLLIFAIGIFATMGALQKGPLTHLIYKVTVSLRGEYWASAINALKGHFFFGVGLDSLGDWYRRERRPSALILPGPRTVINTAHNVILDMGANGGILLLISYLLLIYLGLQAIIRLTLRNRKFDTSFVALSGAWIGFQAQSIVSINQIGLAIWGWLLTGALVAYEISTRGLPDTQVISESTRNRKSSNVQSSIPASTVLTGSIAGLLGLLLALPPFIADAHWLTAIRSKNVEKIQKSGVEFALDSNRLVVSSATLMQNGFNKQALDIARIAVRFNPNSFDSWNLLWNNPNATAPEKEKALEILKMLDPLNPDVQKLK